MKTRPSAFEGLTEKQAREFTDRFHPAWSGNDPDLLASFYSEDVFYSDPGVPSGINGKSALLDYFRKLLGNNPNWTWTHLRSLPLENGFLNFWQAQIPVGGTSVVCNGVCLIQLRDHLIYRNEVFFDRSELLREISKLKS